MNDRIERYPNCRILCNGWVKRGEAKENMTVDEAIIYAMENNYNHITYRTIRDPNTSKKYFDRYPYAICKRLVVEVLRRSLEERGRHHYGVMTILIRPV